MNTAKRSLAPQLGAESSCDDEASQRGDSFKSTADSTGRASERESPASHEGAEGVARGDAERARALIAEGRLEEAERAARSAARAFEASGQKAPLAECLTTLGIAEARAGRHADARRTLMRASEAAEAACDRAAAGRAALALAEEAGETLTTSELCETFSRACELLSGTRDSETLARLNECGRRAVEAAVASRGAQQRSTARAGEEGSTPEERWAGFSLKSEVLRYEAELIERALRDAGGVVSHAARLLGFRHHQTFVALLNNRHKSLLHARNPVVPRRRRGAERAQRAQRAQPR